MKPPLHVLTCHQFRYRSRDINGRNLESTHRILDSIVLPEVDNCRLVHSKTTLLHRLLRPDCKIWNRYNMREHGGQFARLQHHPPGRGYNDSDDIPSLAPLNQDLGTTRKTKRPAPTPRRARKCIESTLARKQQTSHEI
jgi:hypothetical protein